MGKLVVEKVVDGKVISRTEEAVHPKRLLDNANKGKSKEVRKPSKKPNGSGKGTGE